MTNYEIEYKWLGEFRMVGDSIRYIKCPICNSLHPNNPAFSVDKITGQFYCHDCKAGGHIDKLLNEHNDCQAYNIYHSKKQYNNDETAKYIYGLFNVSQENSLTDKYLSKRGIQYNTWSDLDTPLKESQKDTETVVATYPFKNSKNNIVALQRTFINPNTLIRTEKKYIGPKKNGIAILKKAEVVIVAEGLETGLSVRQHLGNSYGLIICGDCNNLETLADHNSWAVSGVNKLILAADNDINNTGIIAARKVLYKYLNKSWIYVPSIPGQDWNDVLLQGRMSEEFK